MRAQDFNGKGLKKKIEVTDAFDIDIEMWLGD